jgi:signal transduction histidine kinase
MTPARSRVACLVVDDRPENLLVLSTLLRRDDVEVLEAQSGPEALELLLVHDVALALLDVQMPDMDGFELAELMRGSERTRNVPIIFVTAGAHDQRRIFQGYETGAVDFLYKPIEPHILINKAEVFFQLYRQKQQLARELKERTETLRLNEVFTAVLGHDLRNPLNAILTGAQLLQLRTEDESVRRTAGTIVSSATHMSRMISDMLDLARARLAGGIPIKPVSADLATVVHRVVQEHQAAHPDRLHVTIEGDLRGQWDTDRLGQIVSNLIGNALRHSEAGSVVDVKVEGTTETISVLVRNAGSIPPEVLPRIFDPFQGGTRGLKRSEGLGLGLYIVQQIVQALHGVVHVESVAGTTVFTVTIPRKSNRSPSAADR